MTLAFTKRARKDYEGLSASLRVRTRKALDPLLEDPRHPSLRTKKYVRRGRNVWQGRIDRSHRLYFLVEEDRYVILRIMKHPK